MIGLNMLIFKRPPDDSLNSRSRVLGQSSEFFDRSPVVEVRDADSEIHADPRILVNATPADFFGIVERFAPADIAEIALAAFQRFAKEGNFPSWIDLTAKVKDLATLKTLRLQWMNIQAESDPDSVWEAGIQSDLADGAFRAIVQSHPKKAFQLLLSESSKETKNIGCAAIGEALAALRTVDPVCAAESIDPILSWIRSNGSINQLPGDLFNGQWPSGEVRQWMGHMSDPEQTDILNTYIGERAKIDPTDAIQAALAVENPVTRNTGLWSVAMAAVETGDEVELSAALAHMESDTTRRAAVLKFVSKNSGKRADRLEALLRQEMPDLSIQK